MTADLHAIDGGLSEAGLELAPWLESRVADVTGALTLAADQLDALKALRDLAARHAASRGEALTIGALFDTDEIEAAHRRALIERATRKG